MAPLLAPGRSTWRCVLYPNSELAYLARRVLPEIIAYGLIPAPPKCLWIDILLFSKERYRLTLGTVVLVWCSNPFAKGAMARKMPMVISMIVYAKLLSILFESYDQTFAVYRARLHGGAYVDAVFKTEARVDKAPPARKTVQLKLIGEWTYHSRYGKQFSFHTFLREEEEATRHSEDALVVAAIRHPKMLV